MFEYWCYWEASCSRYRQKAATESLHEVKDGFWVSKYFIYTKKIEDRMYWIPPSGIKFVKRIEVGENGD